MIIFEISRFLFFILIGIILGILFDLFRIIRKCFKTSDLITYIHDILFLVLSGVILLISIFIINNGEIRGYIFLGIFIGILVYFITISKFLIIALTKIILFLKKILIKPIVDFCKFIRKIIKKLINKIKIIIKNIKKIEKKPKNKTNLGKQEGFFGKM